jgi:hypothetical protein
MVTSTMLYPDQHHPTLYFEDGNVVLSAVDKQDIRWYFRVHRSILCRYSPVFQEMFMIPPLTEEGPEQKIIELYDGVLEVQMADSAEDVDSFLSVIYDSTCVWTSHKLLLQSDFSTQEEPHTNGSVQTLLSSSTGP